MAQKILVVVDMQNDFIDGALGSAEAVAVVERVVQKIRTRRAEGYDVYVTMDTHTNGYLDTQEGKKLPVVHCVKGTVGWRLNEKIAAEVAGCRTFEKGGFASLNLLSELEKLNPEVVEFVGVCTDICVVSNALGAKARLPEAEIFVDADCCAGVTVKSHEAALTTMKSCQIGIL